MTEAEWLAWAIDPELMLKLLPTVGAVSDRKVRLFAVACCRHAMTAANVRPRTEPFVDMAECFADGEATLTDLQNVRCHPARPDEHGRTNSALHHACMNAAETETGVVVADCAALNAAWGATQPGTVMPDDNGISEARLVKEQANQCALLRDIFGNPFRPVALDPAWLTPTVTALAAQMYESRDFSPMPILADALQDAGCDSEDILEHCRGPGPHVRGCWVVDLVLGKE
jgi:hypothetical protein